MLDTPVEVNFKGDLVEKLWNEDKKFWFAFVEAAALLRHRINKCEESISVKRQVAT